MEAAGDHDAPASMTLMGGPVDTRRSPTEVNKLAEKRGVEWFRRQLPAYRAVPLSGLRPGGLSGLSAALRLHGDELDRHVTAHLDMFNHLVSGDGDSAEKHREFYDEYLAVMDLAAEYYMQTVETVFVRHALPKGEMTHRGEPVDLTAIRNARPPDRGRREGRHLRASARPTRRNELCANIPDSRKHYYLAEGVGHYGVFNGSRFRKEIAPRIREFIAGIEESAELAKAPKPNGSRRPKGA